MSCRYSFPRREAIVLVGYFQLLFFIATNRFTLAQETNIVHIDGNAVDIGTGQIRRWMNIHDQFNKPSQLQTDIIARYFIE